MLFYIAGICCLVFPDIPGKWGIRAGGIVLILYGVIKIIGYLSRDLYCLAFQYDFACGIFLMVLGILVIAKGMDFRKYLLGGMGILILLDSLLCIQMSMDTKKFGLTAWKLMLASALLSGTCGVVLAVKNTLNAAGFALLTEGLMRQYITQCTVRGVSQYLEDDAEETPPAVSGQPMDSLKNKFPSR